MSAAAPTAGELERELDRLSEKGLLELGYTDDDLERIAPLTWRINVLKKEKEAVIPAHVYQRAEILAGVADYSGDSYKLAKLCAGGKAKRIVFCGVRFMAETAKILNPEKEVLLPALDAGCSLAESITADDVRRLKAKHPGLPVVSYINTTADVKAESDVIVTSANAVKILRWMFARHERLIFLPDEWMGRNLAAELGKTVGKEMVVWRGKCIVHENFDPESVAFYRKAYPGVQVLAHAECSPALVKAVDFVGGTGDMMEFVKKTKAPAYMLVTECGLGDFARTAMPEKRFIPMCRLCPYMKATVLERVLEALESPKPHHRIEVPADVARKARRSIERMFEIAEDAAKA
ncbi:MAG TPA: quinolinate synthase NadA [Elusimicrobiota bacterium]|jgi:quinolinate synthase|nr:quinolinate synthase NadA [Elusimicrobiota bacterium]